MKFLKGTGKLDFFFLLKTMNVDMFACEKILSFQDFYLKNIEFTLDSRQTKFCFIYDSY